MTIEERLKEIEIELKRLNILLAKSREKQRGEEIRARKILLIDEMGIARIALDVGGGYPMISMYDNDGKPCVILTVNENGAGMDLVNATRKESIWIGVHSKFGPALRMTDKKEKTRVTLQVDELGACLHLCDEKDASGVQLVVLTEHGPALVMTDEKDRHRVVLGAAKSGPPELALLDEKGNLISKASK